jgi:transmembrane sensor
MAEQDYQALLADTSDELRLLRNLQAVRRKQGARRLRRARVTASALTAAALLFVASVVRTPWSVAEPGPVGIATANVRSCLTAGACAVPSVAFDDGSRIALDTRTRLELTQNDARVVRTVLHEGWARFTVEPGGPRSWHVQAGPLDVEVVGTSFTVLRHGDAVRVRVHHGRVLVSGEGISGGSRLLQDGEQVAVRPRLAVEAPEPKAPILPRAAPEPERAKRTKPASSRTDETDRTGVSALPRADDDVLAHADALRAAHDVEGARSLLAGALARAPEASSAGLLAFTLGQLELDDAHAAAAARAFGEALQHPSLPASLREQALARWVEALARSGARAEARSARAAYEAAYPSGRWSDAIARWAPHE